MRFGKHPAKNDYRTLRFKSYVKSGLAAPPASYDVLPRVYEALKIKSPNPSALFPMDGNDKYGDCTIAALAHAETTYRGLTGKEKIVAANAVVKFYFHLTRGVDSGLNELDVLNEWRKQKVFGEEILSYVKVDPKDHTHVKQAIQLFGGVYLGFQVQQDCLADFNAHKPWTPGPLLNEGHAVFAVAYDPNLVTVLTWGSTQPGTWAWWDECVDEAYAILPPEATKPGFELPGFDIKQLRADLEAVAN
jgi:hypothetical protein